MYSMFFVCFLFVCSLVFASTNCKAAVQQDVRLIPAQTFIMGDQSGTGRTDAVPAHPVTLDAYYISPNLVTVQEYCDFLNESGGFIVVDSYIFHKDYQEVYNHDALVEFDLGPITRENDKFVPKPGTANLPVYYVFWRGAALYCNYLSEKEGLNPCYRLEGDWPCDMSAGGYHLPTEAQWECAARGGLKGKRFPWGNTINPKLANYDNNMGRMTDVGSYPPNAYGLYDMSGNIMEWCNDWYEYDYYSSRESGERNPQGPVKDKYSKYKSVRGSGYYQPAEFQECSYRYGPSDGRAGYNFNGFRVVREALTEIRDPARESRAAKEWIEKSFIKASAADVPISFTLGGKHSSRLLKSWDISVGREQVEDGKRSRTVTLSDPKTKLEIACEITTFDGFPAVDWLLRVTNRGDEDSPIIEDLRVLDDKFEMGSGDAREFILRRSRGSRMSPLDFAPTDEVLGPKAQRILGGHGGRSSDYDLPFMNLSWGRGGVVLGVGWTGQWETVFTRDKSDGLRVQTGMQKTHLKLYPGESIRTPRMLLVFWDGTDMLRGHNLFRKLILAHYNPRIDGKLVTPPICQAVTDLNNYTEQNQLAAIPVFKEAGIEVLWIDAGWFVGGWPHGMGNWTPRPDAFPNGLGPVGNAAHEAGMKFLVWFEPERASRGSMIDREYSKWVIGPVTEYGGLFNWGIPEAREWMTDLLSKQISEGKIDIFRNDFNMEPLYYLQRIDELDRQGIAEIRFFEGMYKMWDDLRERHPGLWIDNCASGGRMIDIETTMRSIPLWQSDSQVFGGGGEVTAQLQNAGLNLYIPMHSGGNLGLEPSYAFRSAMMTGNMGVWPPNEQGKATVETFKLVRPYFEGDYYPLFEHKVDESAWFGYQLDLPEEGRGMVVAFRRQNSTMTKNALFLHAIDLNADYEVTNKDSGTTTRVSGAVLRSYIVEIPETPGSRILFYKKVQD